MFIIYFSLIVYSSIFRSNISFSFGIATINMSLYDKTYIYIPNYIIAKLHTE